MFVFELICRIYQLCNNSKPSESQNVGDVWNKPKSLDDKDPAPVMMIDPMTGVAWNLMSRMEESNRAHMAGDLNKPKLLEPMTGSSNLDMSAPQMMTEQMVREWNHAKHLEPMTGAPWSEPIQLDMNGHQMMTEQMVGVSNEPNQLEPMLGGSRSESTQLDKNEQLLGAPWSIDAITAGISKIVAPLSPSVSTFYYFFII